MRSRLLALAAAAALILPVFACGRGRTTDEIVIGEYGSLTGGIATFGISTKNGSTMAFDEINNAGGVLGKKIKLLVEDDQSKPEEAGTVVTKLINQNHVVAMLGQVASSHSLAAAPICQANHVPMVSPSSTNPRVTQMGDYIFRVCFIDPFQGAVMAKFAANTLKVKQVAILVDVRSDYSVGLQTFFREQFKQLGGEIVSEQSYSQGDSDFRAQLTQIKAINPDAIYVPGLLHGGRHDRPPGARARHHRERPASGRRRLGLAQALGDRRRGLERLLLLQPLLRRRSLPLVQKFVSDYKARFNGCRTPWPPSDTTRPRSWRTP